MNANIRIFISSTFQDMHAERDFLIKKIFPEIINEAAKRFVSVVPLDLRWGITDDEAKSGKVVDICLNEIDNSRPYFIGIIGDRYGWCPTPEEINLSVIEERYPSIKRYVENKLSITEIEMQYAVLDTELESNALFLLKQTTAGEEEEKLSRFKELIKQKRPNDWYNYNSIEQLGQIVRENFMNFLDVNFPKKECSDHERLCRSLKNIIEEKSIGYVDNNPYVFQQLLHNIRGNEPSVELLIGKRGNGKSSFITNFIRILEDEKDYTCAYYLHDEIVTEKTLECILDYFNKMLNFDSETTDLSYCKPKYIVVDGIDRLPNFAETDLYKLLDFFKSYHIVLTLDSDSEHIRYIEEYPDKSHCNRLYLEVLSIDEKHQVIEGFLQKHRKKLSHQQYTKLIKGNASQLTSLCTALNCLVSFGHFENLDDYINKLTQMDDKGISEHALNQIREVFGKDSIDKVLALIIVSKHGLNESELSEIMGFRQIDWSAIYSSLVNFFVSQNRLLMLKDSYKATAENILTSEQINTARQAIICYFCTINSDRSCEELAYQYLQIEDYNSLYNLILCYKNFKSLYLIDEYELAVYWRRLIAYSPEKYSLEVYLDFSQKLNVNKPLQVEHNIVGDFILSHFNDPVIAMGNYKKYECINRCYSEDEEIMDDDMFISPMYWYCYSQTKKKIMEKLKYLEKACNSTFVLMMGFKGDCKYAFLSYLEKANLYLELFDLIQACDEIDNASYIRRRYFPKNQLMNAMECRIVSQGYLFLSLPEKAIEEARRAVMFSVTSPSESIQSYENLLRVLIHFKFEDPSLEKQAYIAAQRLKIETKRFYGQNSVNYARVLIELGKSYAMLFKYTDAGVCLKQAREIYEQKNMPIPANLNDRDFKAFKLGYLTLCNVLGNLYACRDSGVTDIAAAYYWLKECQQSNNECNLYITELRNKQLDDFENGVLNRDEEYICRLVFPSDNSFVDEEIVLEQIKDKDSCFSKFSQSYTLVRNTAEIFSIKFPTSALDVWIEQEGANKVIHQIKLAIIRCWVNLKKEFPELSNIHLVNDEELCDAAEKTQIRELQIFLVLLLEVIIDMEGFEIGNRELYYEHLKENIVNGNAKREYVIKQRKKKDRIR